MSGAANAVPGDVRGALALFVFRDLSVISAIVLGRREDSAAAFATAKALALAELGAALAGLPHLWLPGVAPDAAGCVAALMARGAGRVTVFPINHPAQTEV